jgi:hypothetical protein
VADRSARHEETRGAVGNGSACDSSQEGLAWLRRDRIILSTLMLTLPAKPPNTTRSLSLHAAPSSIRDKHV